MNELTRHKNVLSFPRLVWGPPCLFVASIPGLGRDGFQ